jgi:hypothetical protein
VEIDAGGEGCGRGRRRGEECVCVSSVCVCVGVTATSLSSHAHMSIIICSYAPVRRRRVCYDCFRKQAKVKQLKQGTSHITSAIGKLQGGMYWARDKSVCGYPHESVSAYVGLCRPISTGVLPYPHYACRDAYAHEALVGVC